HRLLPSFPTRRSSDLRFNASPLQEFRACHLLPFGKPHHSPPKGRPALSRWSKRAIWKDSSPRSTNAPPSQHIHPPVTSRLTPPRDRKSTRLTPVTWPS